MKWLGQHIVSLIARFRSSVYFENVENGATDTDKFLVIGSSGKLKYRTGAEVASDIGAGSGDITGVTAGTGLSGGGTSGAVTLNVDAAQTQITSVGTIGTGVWQGTAIATDYIADNAITEGKLEDGLLAEIDANTAKTGISEGQAEAITTNTAKATNVTTNLTATTHASQITINSSDGTNVVVAEASGSIAGVMTVAHHDKLDGIETSATADQTKSDIDGLAITTVGTVDTGTWQGTPIDSEYLDADTAHLTTDQTFSGTKTFDETIVGSINGAAATVATIAGLAPNTATTQATQAAITTCANLTTVGTIGTGTWNATAIASSKMATGTTSAQGALELATTGEADTGTDTARAVTPAGLKSHVDARYAVSYISFSGQGTMLSSGNWVGPGASGINHHTWNLDFGVNTEINDSTAASYAKQYQHSGIRIPKACVINGFTAMVRNANANNQVTVGLFLGRAADSNLPDWGTTNTIAPKLQCHADANNEGSTSYTNRPVHAEVTGAGLAMAAGDVIYPAFKLTGVTSGGATNNVYASITIEIKTLIA